MLEELVRIDTGDHSAAEDEHHRDDDTEGRTLANVGLCSGSTKMDVRVRRMRTFNTPLFPGRACLQRGDGRGRGPAPRLPPRHPPRPRLEPQRHRTANRPQGGLV